MTRYNVKLVVFVFFVFSLLPLTQIVSCVEKATPENKEEARAKFDEATSKLSKLGGIASFDAPHGQSPFPKAEIEGLSAEEINTILKEVISDLKAALSLDPEMAEAYYFLAIAHTRAGERRSAIEAFKKSINVEPERKLSYILVCALLWDEKEFGPALRIANRFLNVFPGEKTAGLLLVGTTYYRQGNYDRAIEKANEIVSLKPDSVEGRLLLASSYYHRGEKEKAEIQFDEIIRINPNMRSSIIELERTLSHDTRELNQ